MDVNKLRNGELRVNPTRTRAGRKCDTWTFLPAEGEKVQIDVMLHTVGGGLHFEAQSSHPLLRGRKWANTDIEALRREVENGVEQVFGDAIAENWEPVIELETSLSSQQRYKDDGTRFSIALGIIPMRARKHDTPRNDGLREVIRGGCKRETIERDFDTDFGCGDGTLTAANMRFITDAPGGRSLLPHTAENAEAIALLGSILRAFGENLARATGPSAISRKGVPGGSDLVAMMQEAVRNPSFQKNDE